MVSTTSDKKRRAPRILAGVGALFTVAWLLTYLVPTTRQMMLDVAVSFLLTFVTVGLLWMASSRSAGAARTFWRLLATGWTLNLLSSVAWGVYEAVTGGELPAFSLVDIMYVARDILVLVALCRYPGRMTNRRWAGLVAITSAAAAILWVGLFRPALAPTEITLSNFLDFLTWAVYPILDGALVYLALLAWAHAETRRLQNWIGILTLAMVSYGVANWIQFSILILPDFTSDLPGLFWPLTDILTGLAALCVLWRESPPTPTAARQTVLARWLDGASYVAVLITVGLTAGDLIARRGQVDPGSIVCTVTALGALCYHLWRGQSAGEAHHAD